MRATTEKKTRISLNDHIATYMKTDKEFMEGIRKGVRDCEAGRIIPWSEVKKELDIK